MGFVQSYPTRTHQINISTISGKSFECALEHLQGIESKLDKIAGETLKEIAVAIVIVALTLYILANHTSADTANTFGLNYVGTA